ncbi:MAG: TfoX/Sxy family protein [Chloroflexi bacterium]|nr:TfoX/Sxy family protein [Chloroflexota bacterium]
MPSQKIKAKSEKPKRAMPAFTKAPEEMVSLFERAMKDFPMAEMRKMFGYPAAFVNGNMFTGLFQEEMFLRLSDEDRAAIRKEYGTPLFEPMPGRPMRGYVLVPKYVRNSPKLLHMWLMKGMEYCKSLPAKVKRGRKSS